MIVATLNGSEIKYGLILNALISFLLIAATILFRDGAPMNAWKAGRLAGKTCDACLETIAIAARRCKWCGEPQRA